MQLQRRFEKTILLSICIQMMREQADIMSPGPERDKLLTKIQKAENAADIEGCANFCGPLSK